jgi:alkylation response protein AidB-like acyl-CoA dehydrogenase
VLDEENAPAQEAALAQDKELRERVRAFLAEHPPSRTPRRDFLTARFDAGLGYVHYPVGHGGLGLPRNLQSVLEDELAKASAPDLDARLNVIGLGMAAPTIIACASEEQQARCGPARRSGASCSASRAPAATSPRWPPAPSAMATTG